MLVALLSLATTAVNAQAQSKTETAPTNDQAEKQADAGPTPVKLAEGAAELSPENTKVTFVGIHTGDEPKPRLGGFSKFKGSVKVAEEKLESMSMEFDIDSIWTEFADLTTHLKNADFFDVEKYPTAKFVSKKVSQGENGVTNVVGDLTLMGKTNEITVPVKIKMEEGGVLVKGDLKLDRASFGMNKMVDRVAKDVSVTVSVGEKTVGPAKKGNQAAGRGGRGGGRRGNPLDRFKEMDKNGDGKLAGDEIPERMKNFIGNIDSDGDGAVTQEEMKSAMEKMRGGGGGRGQGGGRGRQGGDKG
jgi:polyisoprenoid-binding protein YceI